MALTTTQMTDIRRFMGYPLVGTTMQIGANQDVVYGRFGMVTMSLYTRLTTLTADEEAVLVSTYLTNLGTLEAAIFGTSANLDTAQAAIWTHNAREVVDRTALFDQVRRALCEFIGFPPGGNLGGGNSIKLVRC